MIQSAQTLVAFVTSRLKTHKTCRIYQDVLDTIWPPSESSRSIQAGLIQRFAHYHTWKVLVHTPGDYGLVADFTRSGAHAVVEPRR